MVTVILREPDYLVQKKSASCWFACLKMMLLWHEGDRSVGNRSVSRLASWTTPRAFSEIDAGFLAAHHIRHERRQFATEDEMATCLLRHGPFVGSGKIGKFFVGKRMFGHAILIWGLQDGQVIHHDPASGRRQKMKFASYRDKQHASGILRYNLKNARVEVTKLDG